MEIFLLSRILIGGIFRKKSRIQIHMSMILYDA